MKRIIIDCDPGNGIPGANVDDGIALALALASPTLSVEMITTVAGNTESDVGWQVVTSLLKTLNLNVPVYQGETEALAEPSTSWRHMFDQRLRAPSVAELWKDVPRPKPTTAPVTGAVDAIARHICRHPGEITLVAIGPLTNVARALMRYPAVARCVRDIVIMGGVFAVDDYLKDTNVGMDPEALQVVLHSGAPITLVPLDVTTRTLLTPADMLRFADINTPLARYLAETVPPWLAYSMTARHLPGCWLHDVLTVAWLLDEQVATAEKFQVGVELREGPTRGRTWRYRPPLRLTVGIPPNAGCLVTVLTQVDNARLVSLLERALCASATVQPSQVH